MKKRNKKSLNFDTFDIALIKLSVAAFVLVILKLWPATIGWLENTSIWWFVVATILFAIRPFKKWRYC
jgi:hypothetical protein